MVISIILALCIPLTVFVSGYFILKALEIGQKRETVALKVEREEELKVVEVDEDKAREFQEFINEYTGL